MRYILKPGASHDPLWYSNPMWTPLLLICTVNSNDCGISAAPAYFSRAECEAALERVLETYKLPDHMVVVASTCYNWGQRS